MASKEMIIVAGPNGSGKTTYVWERLSQSEMPYLSVDQIAADFGVTDGAVEMVAAGREFLRHVEFQLRADESFIVESTLSGKTFRRVIDRARANGFDVSIVFVFLDQPGTCVARVQERKRKGGHGVPEDDIRRRYPRSIVNFWTLYRPLANRWSLVYNSVERLRTVAFGAPDVLSVLDEPMFEQFLNVAGTDDGDAD